SPTRRDSRGQISLAGLPRASVRFARTPRPTWHARLAYDHRSLQAVDHGPREHELPIDGQDLHLRLGQVMFVAAEDLCLRALAVQADNAHGAHLRFRGLSER